MAANPRVALLFYWKSLQRQIRIEGTVEQVDGGGGRRLLSRPDRGIRGLARGRPAQSRPLVKRAMLEERLAEMEKRYSDDTFLGPTIGPVIGFCRSCSSSGRRCRYRLHDRTVYRGPPAERGSKVNSSPERCPAIRCL